MTWRYSLQSGGILLAALSLTVLSLPNLHVSLCSRKEALADFISEPCDYPLNRDNGIIQSDNFPLQYPPNYKCKWTHTFRKEGLFIFKPVFLEFPINQTSGKCNTFAMMSLRLRYENPARSGYDDFQTTWSCEDFVDAHRAKKIAVPIRESTHMSFSVSTSWKNESGRFLFHYHVEEDSGFADIHPCGPETQIYYHKTWYEYGHLTSPGYPVLYPSTIECQWEFFQFQNIYFLLTLDIQGESRKNKTCRNLNTDDTITMVDGQNRLQAAWCGSGYLAPEHHFAWTNKSSGESLTVKWKPAKLQQSPYRTVASKRVLRYNKGFKITWVSTNHSMDLQSHAWRFDVTYRALEHEGKAKYILLFPPENNIGTFLFNVSIFTVGDKPMCGARYIDVWSYYLRSADRLFNCDTQPKLGDPNITFTESFAATKHAPIALHITFYEGAHPESTVRIKYDLSTDQQGEEYCYMVTKCRKEGGCVYIGHVTSDKSSFPTESCLLGSDEQYDDDYDQDRYEGKRYIQLVIQEMDIPESPGCIHSYLYFGGERFCGYHPFLVTKFLTTNGTRSPPVSLRFYTDNKYQTYSYKIWFKIEDQRSSAWTGVPPIGLYGCPVFVTIPTQPRGIRSFHIISPNYPGPYRDPARRARRNYLCEWNIPVQQDGTVYVNVVHVDLVNSDNATSGYYRPDSQSPFVKEEGVRDSRVSGLCLVDAILLGNESIYHHDYKEAVVCEYFQDRIGLWYSFPAQSGIDFPIRFLVREAKSEWMTRNNVEPDTPPVTEHTIAFVEGFSLLVHVVPDCTHVRDELSTESGHDNPEYIQSHNWPNTGYFPNQRCSWEITSQQRSRGFITMMFRDLDLDNEPDSCTDSVTIRWENSRRDYESYRYCGLIDGLAKPIRVPIVSAHISNVATIQINFTTDAVKNYGRGFSLVMYFEPLYSSDGDDCGGPLMQLRDGLQSPGYPHKYHGYSSLDSVAPPECIWSWYPMQQYGQLRVLIYEMDIPKEGGKCGSHLAFTFNNSFGADKQESEQSVSFCGSHRNLSINRQVKRGADVYIKFVRTLHRADGKFKVTFQWTPTQSANDSAYCARASQGTDVKEITPFSIDTWDISYPPRLANGSAQTWYDGSRQCSWDIVTKEHHVKATVRLRYLDVESSPMCISDHVDIFYERFCGSNEEWQKRDDKDKETVVILPPNRRSSLIYFDADNLVQGHGFKLDMELEAVHSTGESFLPNNCKRLQSEYPSSGARTLVIQQLQHIEVYCDQQAHGGGWTVIQRRKDGSVSFNRNWKEYEEGFGDLNGNFWMGLKNIYGFTNEMEYKLLVELTAFDGSTAYAMYDHFRVEGPDTNYILRVHGYSGTAGDGLGSIAPNDHETANGVQFSTPGIGGCATALQGGWWYNVKCGFVNLNGMYGNDTSHLARYLFWSRWRGDSDALKHVEMKIRPAYVET